MLEDVVAVQSISLVRLFATPWTIGGFADQASLSFTISRSLLKLMFNELVMPSNHLHPLSSPSSPAFYLSQHQGLFQWVGSLHQVAKVLELQHQSYQWIFSEWKSMNDFLAVQRTLKSSPTPQFKILNSVLSLLHGPTLTSIHDYWKNHSLTIWTFVGKIIGKIMSVLFNTLSRFVTAVLGSVLTLYLCSMLQIFFPQFVFQFCLCKNFYVDKLSIFSPCIWILNYL